MSEVAIGPFEIRISGLETPIRFKTLKQLNEWAGAERARWQELLRRSEAWGATVRDHVANNSNLFHRLEAASESTIQAAIKFFSGQNPICSKAPIGRAIFALAAANIDAAIARYAMECQLPIQLTDRNVLPVVNGLIQASLFERDPQSLRGIERAAFARLRTEWDEQMQTLEQSVQANIEAGKTTISQIMALRDQEEKTFAEALALHKKSMKDLEELYEKELRVGAPADYWSSLASGQRWAAIGFFGAFCAVGTWAGLTIWINRLELIGFGKELADQVNIGTVALFSIPTLIVLWVMRLLAKQFIRISALFFDAKHRVVLVQTYKALIADPDSKVTEDQRLLILQALFRPGPDGAADDAPPPSLLELMTRSVK